MNSLLPLLAKESVKVATLEDLYTHCHLQPHFFDAALSAMRQLDSDIAWRAVWLLKRAALNEGLTEANLVRLAQTIDEFPHWASRLNLCQLFARTGVPPAVRETAYPYFVECFANSRVIIRAWAISVLVQYQDDPSKRIQVAAFLRAAKKDPAGSMAARLRHLARRAGSSRPSTKS